MGITKEQFRSILLPNLRVREGFALMKSDTTLVLTVTNKTSVYCVPRLRLRQSAFSNMVCKHQRHRGDGGRGDTGQAHSFFPLHSADLHESQMTLSVGPWWRTAQAAATVRENSLEMAGQSLAGTLLRFECYL